MNTKEAINYVESKRYVMEHCDNNKLADEVIDLLERGEKYEQIVYELENFTPEEDMKIPEEYLGIKGGVIRYVTKIIKQKYFPEPKEEVIK